MCECNFAYKIVWIIQFFTLFFKVFLERMWFCCSVLCYVIASLVLHSSDLIASIKLNYLFQIQRYNLLLDTIRQSLRDLEKGIQGLVVMTLELEIVFNSLYDGHVPPSWQKVRDCFFSINVCQSILAVVLPFAWTHSIQSLGVHHRKAMVAVLVWPYGMTSNFRKLMDFDPVMSILPPINMF